MTRDDATELPIIGRERALVNGLSKAIHHVLGGPPPSKKTMAELRRHQSGALAWETRRGRTFEVALGDPDGKATGHVVRVSVELDRFEPGLGES